MSQPEFYYAYYSEQAAQQCGYCIYENASGTPVKITLVSAQPNPTYGWKDAVFVGIVCKFISSHRGEIRLHTLEKARKELYAELRNMALGNKYQASDTLPGSY